MSIIKRKSGASMQTSPWVLPEITGTSCAVVKQND